MTTRVLVVVCAALALRCRRRPVGALSVYCPRLRLGLSLTVNAAPPVNPGAVANTLFAAALQRPPAGRLRSHR